MGDGGESVESVYDKMTPAELRKVADRRELVERARVLAVRHDARLRLVQALHAIDRSLVAAAHADRVMKAAVLAIVEAEKAETKITNGDVSRLSYGPPATSENWWREATASHPEQVHDDLLDDIEHRRKTAW